MSRTKRSFWKVSLSVFANVLHETLILEDFFACFCECLVRNACFGRLHCPFLRMSRTKRSFWKISLSVFVNVSYETLILEVLFTSFCECLVRSARFGRFPSPFLRMSRAKRLFWKLSLSVFANVSYETLILEDLFVSYFANVSYETLILEDLLVFANVSYETLILEDLFVSFCECLVRKAHFGRFPCPFLRMSRMKGSFWEISLSVFVNVSYETLILEVFLVRFCECLVRNAHFGSLHSHFLRMSRVKRSFWKSTFSHFLRMSRVKRSFWKSYIFSLLGNVSCETLVLEVQILTFCECLVRNARFGSPNFPFLGMSRVKRSFWKSTFSLFANSCAEE